MSTQIRELHLTGMTCAHCVRSVRDEIGALPGVTGVQVDLVPGGTSTVVVTTGEPLPDEALRAAVDEAGYTVVG